MKGFYAVAIILTIIVLCLCAERAAKSEKKIAVAVRRVLSVAVFTAIGNLFVVLSENEMLSMVSYSLFFVGIDLLLYELMVFSVEYIGYTGVRVWERRLVRTIILLDSLSMLLNIFFKHAFTCRLISLDSGERFYRITSYAPYGVHLVLSYLLVAAAFASLIYKCYVTPAFYRKKYVVLLLILAVIIAADALYVFLNQVVDVSILLFAVAGISIFYYSVEYVPKQIVKRTQEMVVKGLAEGVLVFDVEGKCIYFNESAGELLGIDCRDIKKIEEIFAEWSQKANLLERRDFSHNYTEKRDGKEIHTVTSFRRLEDKNGKYVGCVFVIQDRTAELEDLGRRRYQATHDKLTGLYNEDYFYEQARYRLEENPDGEYLMISSDVKDFKLLNDVFGTDEGDRLLKQIASEMVRQARPGDVYGRIGKDRFALLMEKKNYKESVFVDGPAETARTAGDLSYPVSIYVGVYEIVDISMPISGMCDRTFMAIETIKGNFQKRVAYYDDSMRESALREKELSGDFEEALSTGQFQIYLQPQVTVEGVVSGAEALVRWIHPQKGLIMPGEFIEIFEKNGMVARLDRQVWRLACECLKKWKKEGKTEAYISVNISPRDFYFLDVYKTVTELVKEDDIEPRNLKLEITETAIMMNIEKQMEIIEKLQQAGFIVEMDDFGSGFSSLNMLKEIIVDELKVDMVFLRKTKDEERGRKILQKIVEMSKELGMPVIIEGVETLEQVNFLKKIGCDIFQGYYFARPVAVAEFEETYL